MEKRERIRQLLPLIGRIKEEKLRDDVVGLWVRIWEESDWEDVTDCRYNLEFDDFNLIQHTNFVMSNAMAMASYILDKLRMPVNIDVLLAGTALHDAGYLMEYSPPKDKPVKSAIGQCLIHGSYGAHVALNAGLPLEVINLISTHTIQFNGVPQTIEGMLTRYADLAAGDTINLSKGRPINLGLIDLKLRGLKS